MINGVLILHILITAALIGLVLIQKSEGGALGMGGGSGGGFMTSRGTANLLTRATAVMVALFFLTTLGLALLSKGEGRPKSILDEKETSPLSAPALPTPGAAKPAPAQPVSAEEKEEETGLKTDEKLSPNRLPADTLKSKTTKSSAESNKTASAQAAVPLKPTASQPKS